MDSETAISKGCAWEETRTRYDFESCKLINNNVQPVPSKKEVINNTAKTSVVIHRSIF